MRGWYPWVFTDSPDSGSALPKQVWGERSQQEWMVPSTFRLTDRRMGMDGAGLMLGAVAAFFIHALSKIVPAGELQILRSPWLRESKTCPQDC